MTISNQSQAKRFFIHKILQQAQTENVSLTDAEKYMLSWSEREENFKPDQKLIDQFYIETSDIAFEKKIGELLRQVYKDDVNKDKNAKESYQKAYMELNKGDHYILNNDKFCHRIQTDQQIKRSGAPATCCDRFHSYCAWDPIFTEVSGYQ